MPCKENVVFLGERNDMAAILEAADCFIFPSYYEGLPLALIEAQARGIPCFISDTISEQVRATNYVKKKSINDSAAEWADMILTHEMVNLDKEKEYAKVKEKYDISNTVADLMEIYERG